MNSSKAGLAPLVSALLVSALLVSALAASPAAAETIPEPIAVLQGLDKTIARVSQFDAPIGTPVRFGSLSILVRDCEKNAPEDRPENAAFLEITELRPGEAPTKLFSGWMFSSSPALAALEHPVYDVTVLECKAAIGSPPPAAPPSPPPPVSPLPGNAGGKTAR